MLAPAGQRKKLLPLCAYPQENGCQPATVSNRLPLRCGVGRHRLGRPHCDSVNRPHVFSVNKFTSVALHR
jgi:hypothetical protein